MVDRIFRIPRVAEHTGLSRSTIYLRIAAGLFPEPIQLGPRMVGWCESEVAAINGAHIRGATPDEIRSLVATLVDQRKRAA